MVVSSLGMGSRGREDWNFSEWTGLSWRYWYDLEATSTEAARVAAVEAFHRQRCRSRREEVVGECIMVAKVKLK